MIMKKKETLYEFLRYGIVGGVSAVVDMGVNYLTLYGVLHSSKDGTWQVALSVAVGFAVGLAVNFLLSNWFVFRTKAQRKKGKTVGAFLLYALVGVIGFAMTEALTLLGRGLIGDSGGWYLLLTCAVKGIVLIWNYAGRKLLVYRNAE